MDRFITLQQAYAISHIPQNILINMCDQGTIRANLYEGSILVSEQDVINNSPIESHPDYQQFASLAGQSISISEAGRKYGIHQQTITRWIQRGWIRKLGIQGRKVFIDESYIAFYSYMYKAQQGKQGKWIFGKNGAIYQKSQKRAR